MSNQTLIEQRLAQLPEDISPGLREEIALYLKLAPHMNVDADFATVTGTLVTFMATRLTASIIGENTILTVTPKGLTPIMVYEFADEQGVFGQLRARAFHGTTHVQIEFLPRDILDAFNQAFLHLVLYEFLAFWQEDQERLADMPILLSTAPLPTRPLLESSDLAIIVRNKTRGRRRSEIGDEDLSKWIHEQLRTRKDQEVFEEFLIRTDVDITQPDARNLAWERFRYHKRKDRTSRGRSKKQR